MATRRVILLGSTGSIGTQTLDAIAHLNALHDQDPATQPDHFEVVGLVAGNNRDLLAAQAARFGVRRAVAGRLGGAGGASGEMAAVGIAAREVDHAERMVREVDCDLVVSAMVGVAGLPATLAAAELGRDIALANKEALVAAGSLIVPAARASGARLLPVDSEHSAVWQCMLALGEPPLVPPFVAPPSIAKVILTASGGALRSLSKEHAYRATPAQALAHPTWSMGAKVTLDSASLTNKAFEVIEAHWLFGLESSRIGVLIHPQSIVHSLVEFADGNVLAQLGSPDMRGPIQFALTAPRRPAGCSRKLDLTSMSRLDFDTPSHERFPALALAYRVIDEGGSSGAVFNAASEEATLAFLAGSDRLPFGRIPELAESTMNRLGVSPVRDLADVLEADTAARRAVREAI